MKKTRTTIDDIPAGGAELSDPQLTLVAGGYVKDRWNNTYKEVPTDTGNSCEIDYVHIDSPAIQRTRA